MVDEEALEVPDDSEIPDLRRLLQVGPAGAGSRSACSGRAGAAAALIVVGRPRLALRPPLGRRRSRPCAEALALASEARPLTSTRRAPRAGALQHADPRVVGRDRARRRGRRLPSARLSLCCHPLSFQ